MVRQATPDKHQQVSMFAKTLWFYILFFLILMMIASFGLVAES